jgi:acyl dehydratase
MSASPAEVKADTGPQVNAASQDAVVAAPQEMLLKSLPNAKALLLKAAATATRKPTMDTLAPALSVRVNQVKFSAAWVSAYNKVCGFEAEEISLTAPQVLASGLHLHLMANEAVPFPMLGMVHMYNEIESFVPLSLESPYDVVVSFGETRKLPLGLEFQVITRFFEGEQLVWQAVMTILSRIKGARVVAAKPAPLVELDATEAQYVRLDVPENQGRKYAKVSNDYNPIHLHAKSASLFGFSKAIAHGMWTAARLLADVSKQLESAPARYEVRFKQPVFLPSSSMVKFQAGVTGAQYQLLSSKDSKVLMEGRVSASL